EIAVTVFMENAGGGSAMAAPVARQIFDFYMGNIEDIKRPAVLPPQFRSAEELTQDRSETLQQDIDSEPEPEPMQDSNEEVQSD
ncbi:MAG: penicillin-binding protein 2, partial [Candidatus Cloacimonetes bacterium]|nr:penicillin-binding protein 2 [Candidatus Cloacimonadota bacterium]